ncbi:MAG: hypothetical protein KDA25_10470, partial [Phycisphaerales bacterium]|nr:hypothetical protein [Phycisphaerales bacterium]
AGAAAVSSLVMACVAGADVRYAVLDLGEIDASSVCPCFFGVGLNAGGQATGNFFNVAGDMHTFLWSDGTMVDIGTLGGESTVAQAMGARGSIVGFSDTPTSQHAFLFRNGAMTDLGTLGGMFSAARGVNALDVVVGNAQRVPPEDYSHAFRWANGVMTDLGTLGGPFSDALAVNDAGDVVGWAWNAAWDAHATYWAVDGAPPLDLGVIGAWTNHSAARDINASGQIVGSSQTDEIPDGLPNGFPSTHAVLWENGVLSDLGLLPEAGHGVSIYGTLSHTSTVATAINDAGVTVGNSTPPTSDVPPRHGPFIIESGGTMTNLNDLLLDEDAATWNIVDVSDINEAGEIVGSARVIGGSNHSHAVVLIPVDVPDADLDDDGTVGASDLAALLAAWGPCAACAADLDGDGTVGPADLAILLGAWG